MKFTPLATDRNTSGRLGRIDTPHGEVLTPAFMPVGTAGSVKTMSPRELREVGAEIILANAYHLMLRPGHELIRDLGGLHKFMGWAGAILTDSGGYQAFSLAPLRRIAEEGISFRSHLDGSPITLTPERSIEIQEALGADIAMVLDECLPHPCPAEYARTAVDRTLRWARRSRDARRSPAPALFGIVQGVSFPALGEECAREIVALDFDGYAVGGLGVGETAAERYSVLERILPILPADRPRYVMGVGMPEDLVEAVCRGADLFDCVLPTRHARNGSLFTSRGRIAIKHAAYERDARPIDPSCRCYVCRNFSRAYLRHLFQAKELLAAQLLTHHNLQFYLGLMEGMRKAIAEGHLEEFRAALLSSGRGEAA